MNRKIKSTRRPLDSQGRVCLLPPTVRTDEEAGTTSAVKILASLSVDGSLGAGVHARASSLMTPSAS